MNDMIKKIIDTNKQDLLKRKSEKPVAELKKEIKNLPKSENFSKAFEDFGIIAEIKLASPSAGDLANPNEVLEIAGQYRGGGAAAVSVITEKYFFKGDINFIKPVKEKTGLPVLQKDFVVDPYQIYEGRAAGADAFLLIAKIVSLDDLKIFTDLCLEVDMEPVVEINDEADLENALQTRTKIISVNARNLDTFKVDVESAGELLKQIPDNFVKLGFSGVNSKEEVDKYREAGARGVLIGTNLIKSTSRKEFLRSLRGA